MMKKSLLFLLVVVLLTGCSAQTGKKDLTTSIDEIEQALQLQEPDFAAIKLNVEKLKKQYDKHEWKIHLIGDEGEYERLNETINRLMAAIESEEQASAQLELATLKTVVNDIYSL